MGGFGDEVSFELRQRGEDVKHQPPARGPGVDVLLQGSELDSSFLQLGHLIDQMPDRSTQAFQAPDHDCAIRAQLVEKLSQLWARCQCPGGGVGEDLVAAGSGEGIVLQVGLVHE